LFIFSAIDAPRGGLHIIFGHHEQWGLPTKMASKPYLKWSLKGCSTLLTIINGDDICKLQFFFGKTRLY